MESWPSTTGASRAVQRLREACPRNSERSTLGAASASLTSPFPTNPTNLPTNALTQPPHNSHKLCREDNGWKRETHQCATAAAQPGSAVPDRPIVFCNIHSACNEDESQNAEARGRVLKTTRREGPLVSSLRSAITFPSDFAGLSNPLGSPTRSS